MRFYTPQLEDGGPDSSTLIDTRITLNSIFDGRTDTFTDDWKKLPCDADGAPWMGTTTFLTSTSAGSGSTSEMSARVSDKAKVGYMISSRPWGGRLAP